MDIIILGPQGSGKGTQAELLAEKFGWKYFEAGKILRSIAKSDNKYASKIKEAMNKGNLVPDEYLRLIAWDFINKHDKNTGFIFDGYPRSLAQYLHLEDMLRKFGKKLDAVINIKISEAESIARLEKRRTCIKCGKIYIGGDKCECGGQLVQREDDKPDAVKRRLQIYHTQTAPVFEKALSTGIGYEINGEQTIDKVHIDILAVLKL